MKKETLIAVILGIGAGIGIAIFVIQGARNATNTEDVILDEQISPTVSLDSGTQPLLISKPEDKFVTQDTNIEVSGQVQEGSLLVIQTPTSEEVIETDSNQFSFDVNLLPGENKIKITSYTDKNIDSRSLVIYRIETP